VHLKARCPPKVRIAISQGAFTIRQLLRNISMRIVRPQVDNQGFWVVNKCNQNHKHPYRIRAMASKAT